MAKPREFIDARQLSLSEWVSRVVIPEQQRDYQIEDYRFPTDSHREEYLSIVQDRSEKEIKQILRGFLIPCGRLGQDSGVLDFLTKTRTKKEFRDLNEKVEWVRRLLGRHGAWEGITWILDLLPHRPGKAIDALDAFFSAHVQFLPDGRWNGLEDAEAIIRQRYFHKDNPRDALLSLRPDEFEYLVGSLYEKMGYEVSITRSSKDGGIDVLVADTATGRALRVLVQCKRYQANIGVKAIRELLGVVTQHQANKGTFVTTSDFTSSAKKEATLNPLIELINFQDLNILLNQHLGSDWPTFITYSIRHMQQELERRSE